MGPRISKLVLGPLHVNTYIVANSDGECLVIDPGGCDDLVKMLKRRGCCRVVVVATHGHFDHVAGIDCTLSAFPGIFAAHEIEPLVAEASLEVARLWGFNAYPQRRRPDRILSDGDVVEAAGLRLRVMHTPGHSPDHLVLYSEESKLAFTGDLVFGGSIGRTDLPGGDGEAMARSIARLSETLGRDCRLLPGHGPETTWGVEIEENPHVKMFTKKRSPG